MPKKIREMEEEEEDSDVELCSEPEDFLNEKEEESDDSVQAIEAEDLIDDGCLEIRNENLRDLEAKWLDFESLRKKDHYYKFTVPFANKFFSKNPMNEQTGEFEHTTTSRRRTGNEHRLHKGDRIISLYGEPFEEVYRDIRGGWTSSECPMTVQRTWESELDYCLWDFFENGKKHEVKKTTKWVGVAKNSILSDFDKIRIYYGEGKADKKKRKH